MDEQFQIHACQYNEFQQLNTVPGNEETELQQLQRRTINLMKENVANIREITKDSTNVCSEIECSLCCRKFVHENGLYRHWEMHFGELLAESRVEDPKIIRSFALCVFCGEVFICEIGAWDHLVSHHVLIDENKYLPLDTNNNIQNESPLANEAENESQKSGKLQISGFVRMVTLCKVYQCEFCDSIFSNAKSALFHASQHAPSGFCCYTCEVRVISLKDILLHRRDECIIRRDVRSPLLDFSFVFVCNVCNEEFRGLEQLSEHR